MITVFSGVRGDTRRYRTLHLYQQFRLMGVECQLSHSTDPALIEKVRRSKIVVLHRTAMDAHIRQVFDLVAASGGMVIQDTDDLVFDPTVFRWIDSPDFQDPVRSALYLQDMNRYRQTLQSTQAVLASTNFLAERVRQFHPKVWVHRNAFSLEMLAASAEALRQKQDSQGKLVIGYASGTPTHNRDFDLVAAPLQAFLRQNSQAELWLIGPLKLSPDWEPYAERIRRFALVPWLQLPSLIAQFDINLAPLVNDNPFNRSKSEIKYMEAAMVKVPTIASGTDAFQFAIRSGENGFLSETPEEWSQALETLLSEKRRAEVAECAYKRVMEEYHPVTRAGQLLDSLAQICSEGQDSQTFAEIFQNAREHLSANRSRDTFPEALVSRDVERHPNRIDQGLYLLRHQSLKTFIGQVWVFFRRLFAPLIPYHRMQKFSARFASLIAEEQGTTK